MLEEKKVLIDTVWLPHHEEWLENLEKEIDIHSIDYIVMNHGEVDHSGSLQYLMEKIPNTPIYCTANAVKSLTGQYHHPEWNFHVVKTGDTLDVGNGKKLVFVEMMMLHWPDSMKTVYETDVFQPIIHCVEDLCGKKYGTDDKTDMSLRIIADHVRTATFILGDEQAVTPSNVGAGYILRRIIRRAVRHGRKLGIEGTFLAKPAKVIIDEYIKAYPEFEGKADFIFEQLTNEENKFLQTLTKGEAEFDKMLPNLLKNPHKVIPGRMAFRLYDTFGFPIELTEELGTENGMTVDVEGFKEEEKKHQEESRTLSAGSFKSGLGDHSEISTKYHTATHLLQQALVNVLGDEVAQKGSNITPERLRFDFSFSRAMTKEEVQKVEDMVILLPNTMHCRIW